MLVRDYLRRALYDTSHGYFARSSPIIYAEGSKAGIDFTQLAGRKEWTRVQEQLAESKGDGGSGEWLTQSELFAPYFSQTLMEFAVPQFRKADRFNVVEIGGGSGSNALSFLDGLKARYPDVYAKCKYTICEISPKLSEIQLSRLSGRHENVITVERKDFLNWDRVEPNQTLIIAMEVLDNMPHDKIILKPEVSSMDFADSSKWNQVIVDTFGVEIQEPLVDNDIVDAMNIFLGSKHPKITKDQASLTWKRMEKDFKKRVAMFGRHAAESGARATFVPTGALALLKAVHRNFPQHVFLAGDFAFLPFGNVRKTSQNIRIPGTLFGVQNAPIVSGIDRDTGERKDFPTYILEESQKCDVFFQTDFDALAHAYQAVAPEESNVRATCEVLTSPLFLDTFVQESDRTSTTTRDGFNPMIEDFENVSFLIGRRM